MDFKTFNHNFVDLPKLKRIEVDGERRYQTPAGKAYMSVTTLTGKHGKKEIFEWRQRVGDEKANAISKRATGRGTNLHKTIENYLLNQPASWQQLDEDVLNKQMFVQIKPILERIDNIRVLESGMYSDKLELAGTPDCIADYITKERGPELSVIDFKTSTRMKKEESIPAYFMQGAAYGVMYHEHTGELPKNVVIMMAVETASYPLTFVKPMKDCVVMLVNFMKAQGHYGCFRD